MALCARNSRRQHQSELPGVRGYSERNLKRMPQFFRAYPGLVDNGPPSVAPLTEFDRTYTHCCG